MRLVILESPYAGDVAANETYARACVRDSLLRGESPIASHLLYTQPGVLDDKNGVERAYGILAGLAWGERADATVAYVDRGVSSGMHWGLARAHLDRREVEFRALGGFLAVLKLSENDREKIACLAYALTVAGLATGDLLSEIIDHRASFTALGALQLNAFAAGFRGATG